jgi:hypothetical protein
MTLRSSGPHRDHVPSPGRVEPVPLFVAGASGPHFSDRLAGRLTYAGNWTLSVRV